MKTERRRLASGVAIAVFALAGLAGRAAQAQHPHHGGEVHEHGTIQAATPAATAQTTCPVTGKGINKRYSADHDGKRVYFCCPACNEAFQKDPDASIKKLEDAGVTLEKTQTTCPVMGGAVNKKVFADHAGKRVYFCCPGCNTPFKKDAAKHIQALEGKGITLEKTPAPLAPDGGHGGHAH